MDRDAFWELIEHTRNESNGDIDLQTRLLVEVLKELGTKEILAFDRIHTELMDQAYTADLWDAAEIIGCGCGDDGFMDFRAWLIGQGKEIYERVIETPEGLIDILDEDNRFDIQHGITLVAHEAFAQLTGSGIISRYGRSLPTLRGKARSDAEKKARFPQLIDKFGDCFE